ncbi:hypothetical protein V1264_019947 [Littorina saxatilis]|uniref:Hemicentin-1 n=1 Tax=Littorina saxatilis TaxID=31220 RepID=A0AAN9B949_9CAEN
MKLQSLALLGSVLLSCVFFVEGRVFCFRRLKKRGKCGGHLKKLNYASPEDCCAGRGVGFATRKQKVGRNRFVCTPCTEPGSSKLPLPKKKDKKHNKRRNNKKRNKQADAAARTTSPPRPLNDVTQPETTTKRVDDWPKPRTENENKFGYYSFPRSDDDDVVKVEWSDWSPCSATCGAGWRSRFKVCDGCDKNDYENVMSRPCMINFYCPVDGNWGPWFPWQSCSQSCNGGTRVRQRKCNYPPPAYGGQTCPGPAGNEQDCNEQPCPVDGAWSTWSEFTLCSATCGPGVKRRVRACDSPSPANGGKECPGSPVLTRKCEMTKCPQDGHWSLWAEWSQCTATCGAGLRTRSRGCNSPRPMHGGKDCEGESVQTMNCVSARPCPVNGAWSEWNDYGFCRAPRCSWGFRIRTRLCSQPRPQHGGRPCEGTQYQRVECFNDQDCPRNGTWCPWSDWSACSATCAEQTSLQVRQRTCTCPDPRFGGNDCEGDSLEVRDCSDVPYCNIGKEGKAKGGKSRMCGDSEVEGSGADEDCDQEEEGEGEGEGQGSEEVTQDTAPSQE